MRPTITTTTRKIAVGQPIAGQYLGDRGTCLDYSGTITKALSDGRHWKITVEFSNGTVKEYDNVRPDGESDHTLPMGVCDGCGQHMTVFGLTVRHSC